MPQYKSLLQLANQHGRTEPHHYLMHWAGGNQDIVEKLSSVKGARSATYFKYLITWWGAETKILGFFVRAYLRKLRLLSSLMVKRFNI